MDIKEFVNYAAPQTIELNSGKLSGENVFETVKTLKELGGIFEDENAWYEMDGTTIVYIVQVHAPVEKNTEGGLFFGTTYLMPGKVGNEYFLTQGHFHKIINRSEYYWGIEGDGVLLLMNRNREIKTEKMNRGSLHYIPADTAHRVINYGSTVLSFGACWPADAGYDYDEIKQNGFSARLKDINGKPFLIPA